MKPKEAKEPERPFDQKRLERLINERIERDVKELERRRAEREREKKD